MDNCPGPDGSGRSLHANSWARLRERDAAGHLLWRRVALQRSEQHGNDSPAGKPPRHGPILPAQAGIRQGSAWRAPDPSLDHQRQPGARRRRSLPLRPHLRRSTRPLRRGAGGPGANRLAVVHPNGR